MNTKQEAETDCHVCGGCGEVEVSTQSTDREIFGCPVCIANEKDDVIASLRALQADMLALLRELIDIEGPQPGTAEWAGKVQAAIAKATTPEAM